MIKFTYNKADNIIYRVRFGKINIQELLLSIKEIETNFTHFDKLCILDDARESISVFSEEEYQLLLDEIDRILMNFEEVRFAVVFETPTETALGILFDDMTYKYEKFISKTFSTIEASKVWLLNRSN